MMRKKPIIKLILMLYMLFALSACDDTFSTSPPAETVQKLVTEQIETHPADYGGSAMVKSIGITDFKIDAYGSTYTSYTYNYGNTVIYPVRVETTEVQGLEQYGGEIENRTEIKHYECNLYQNSFTEWEVGLIRQIGE